MEPFEPLLEKYCDSVAALDREGVRRAVCTTFEEGHLPSDLPVFQNTVLRQSVEELDQEEAAQLLGILLNTVRRKGHSNMERSTHHCNREPRQPATVRPADGKAAGMMNGSQETCLLSRVPHRLRGAKERTQVV